MIITKKQESKQIRVFPTPKPDELTDAGANFSSSIPWFVFYLLSGDVDERRDTGVSKTLEDTTWIVRAHVSASPLPGT